MSEIKIGQLSAKEAPTGVRVVHVEVTPEMAATWLANQPPNRTIRSTNVTAWARDMDAGEWLDTAQPLQFNSDGLLLDGQNRLSALVKHGRSLPMWVAINVPDEHRRVIDIGSPRSVADILGILDVKVSSRSHVAAMARAVTNYERQPDVQWSGRRAKWSVPELLDEIQADIDAYRAASQEYRRAATCGASLTWLTGNAHGTLSILVARRSASPELWTDYSEGLITGAGLARTDPRLTLRTSPAQAGALGTWRQQASLMACIKTWNAWITGSSLSKLYVSSPKYLPMPEIA